MIMHINKKYIFSFDRFSIQTNSEGAKSIRPPKFLYEKKNHHCHKTPNVNDNKKTELGRIENKVTEVKKNKSNISKQRRK